VTVDWKTIMARLNGQGGTHCFLPPCPEKLIEIVQGNLGIMPNDLTGMLREFNGAKLFDRSGPLIRVFGITPITPLPPFEWAPDWTIDKYTPAWREAAPGRDREWTIAMKSYGALAILSENGAINEWEKSTRSWGANYANFQEWIDAVLAEGELFMVEN
jgi:hypothetical protein